MQKRLGINILRLKAVCKRRCVGSVTLPQALAQSLQCPLLDPEAPPRRALTVRTVPDPHLVGGGAATAQHCQQPSVHQAALPSVQPGADAAAPAAPADSEIIPTSVATQTASLLCDSNSALHRQGHPAQQQVTSFMVSGQRRVAKRPRVREHRR